MEFPNCQAENKEEAKFCRKCGTKFSVVCAKCGAENLPGYNFFDQCGQNLTQRVFGLIFHERYTASICRSNHRQRREYVP